MFVEKNNMQPKDLTFEDIKISDSITFERSFTDADVALFAKLSGDMNPLHLDDMYALTTKFKKRLVHGMLVGSLCSQLVGMYLPGKRCLYLKQSLEFKNPVFISDSVKVVGTVVSKSESTKIIEVAISMNVGDTIVLEGSAVVQVI